MTNAWELLPAARRWSVKALQEHFECARLPCHVLRSRREKQKYTYYFENLADREIPAEARAAQPCNEPLNLSFRDFLRLARDDAANSYYLQTFLFALNQQQGGAGGAGCEARVPVPALKESLDEALGGAYWRQLHEALGFPTWFRSQLFVGPVGTLGCAHFDQYDNVFLQVRGSKRMLIFDPLSGARGLCPFPVHHPYDQRARVDLEAPDYAAFPRLGELRGGGAEACLAPGEALYLPSHWWHHVESTAGSPDWCVSVNFWFDSVPPRLLNPPRQLGPPLEVELARQVEYLAADALGASAVPRFLAACAAEATARRCGGGGGGGDAPEEGPQWLGARDYILWHLDRIFGPEAVPGFLEDHLDPHRWSGLQPTCF